MAAEPRAAPRWFQLYLPPDRALAEDLVDRAAAAGYRAIVLTVDQPVYGSSPRAARAPLAPSSDIRSANLPGQPIAQGSYKPGHTGAVTFPTTWRDLEWLVARSPLDVVVKGVLRGDDADRCVDAGAKAIIVSNHGGRHLDAALATADALQEVADAVHGVRGRKTRSCLRQSRCRRHVSNGILTSRREGCDCWKGTERVKNVGTSFGRNQTCKHYRRAARWRGTACRLHQARLRSCRASRT